MFKVHINDGSEFPTDDIFYIVGSNGIFLKKSLGIIDSTSPVDKISILKEVDTYASLNIKKISSELICQNVNFLKWVYSEYKSEGMSILHYNDTNEEMKIQVPQQWVSGGGLRYVNDVSFKNFVRLGSIHSHADFGAFHSSIDKGDEFNWDGLHITIGNVNSENVSITASIVANKLRFIVEPTDYIEGISLVGERNMYNISDINIFTTFPESWKMFVETRSRMPAPDFSSIVGSLFPKSNESVSDNVCGKCVNKEFKIELQVNKIIETINIYSEEDLRGILSIGKNSINPCLLCQSKDILIKIPSDDIIDTITDLLFYDEDELSNYYQEDEEMDNKTNAIMNSLLEDFDNQVDDII